MRSDPVDMNKSSPGWAEPHTEASQACRLTHDQPLTRVPAAPGTRRHRAIGSTIDRVSAVKFGYFLVSNANDPLISTAHEVERLGLDSAAAQDHPYQRRYGRC